MANNKFPSLNLKLGFGDSLPLKKNLVHLGFFLYLVDRKDYLKCISEADRMLKFGGFLSIIDFETPFPYSNQYSYNKTFTRINIKIAMFLLQADCIVLLININIHIKISFLIKK